MNCKMPELKRAFEKSGFTDVKTYLASGNVTFDAPKTPIAAMEKKVEAAIEKSVGRFFLVIVRPVDELRALIASDPYKGTKLAADSKRIVTFVRKPPLELDLPVEQDNARLLKLEGNNLFTVYRPTPKGPVFMKLIEKATGKEQTTRTWDTVAKVAGS